MAKSDETPEWFGDALCFGVYAYVLATLRGFSDASFVLNGPAVRLNIGLEGPAGSISLPAVGVSVSILDFFLYAPLLILATHLMLLQHLRRRLLAGALSPGRSLAFVPLAAFAGPAILLAIQGAYAPFATIRPPGSGPAGWMLLVHCAAIAAAALTTVIQLFQPGATSAARPPPASGMLYVMVVCAALWLAYAAYAASLIASAPTLAAFIDGSGGQSGRVVGFGALLTLPMILAALVGRTPPIHKKWRIPMSFRLFLLALATASLSNLAAARSVDLSGVMLVKSPPTEPILLAYLDKAQDGDVKAAWLRAHHEFGAPVNLAAWRLDGANFGNAILIKTDLSGAGLNRARFDGAMMLDADFNGAQMQGASFRGADFRVAQLDYRSEATEETTSSPEPKTQTRLKTANFSGADLTGAIFSRELADRPAEKSWTAYCQESFPKPLNADWLDEVNFSNAILDEANFRGMVMKNLVDKFVTAKSVRAIDLRCGDFRCLDISNNGFEKLLLDAKLEGADFRGAEVPTGVNLKSFPGVKFGNDGNTADCEERPTKNPNPQ